MKSLAFRSGLFAVLAACSGPKAADDPTPQVTPAAGPSGSATQVSDDGATMPAPPTEGSQPADVPHGSMHAADPSRIAQARPDAGTPAPRVPGDAGVRGDAGIGDAGAARDAGTARDAGGGGGVGDAGAPVPSPSRPGPGTNPGPGSAPPPGSTGPTGPSTPGAPPSVPPTSPR